MTAGGGGWGNALERETTRVRMDVLEEYITRDDARESYGVVLSDDLTIDEAATSALRAKMAK